MERGRGSQVIPLRNFFFSCYWLFPFTSGKVTWAMSNVKSHDGLSISLCHLSENECSEKVSENFKMIKLFIVKDLLSVIIFGGINYSSVNIFVTWQKIRHLLPTKFLRIIFLKEFIEINANYDMMITNAKLMNKFCI